MRKLTKLLLTNLFLLAFFSLTMAQTSVLSFDGIDDYVDLGTSAGNGVRTVEMWFRPGYQINSSITDYASLVVRNNGLTNEHNIVMTFSPISGSKGKLYFGIRDSNGNLSIVFSDSDSWNMGQWYHVAGVIHPSQGMMMFIDGKKQLSTNSYTYATTNYPRITTIGCWGDLYIRYFNGSIDDVRFSSDAMYTADFIPPCPDLTAIASTIGMWNFNETTGQIAVDSSSNQFNGQIFGASRIKADICDTTGIGIDEQSSNTHIQHVNIFPNPSEGYFTFILNNTSNQSPCQISIYNLTGEIISSKYIYDNSCVIDLRTAEIGIYFYNIILNNEIISSGKLIKN